MHHRLLVLQHFKDLNSFFIAFVEHDLASLKFLLT